MKTPDYNSQRLFFIIDAILIVAIIIAVLFLPLAFEQANTGNQAGTPTGSFSWVEVVSSTTVKVHIAKVSPSTSFAECDVKIVAPNQETTTVVLKSYTANYTPSGGGLTSLSLSSTSTIHANDSIALVNSGSLSVGVWRVSLIYKDTEETIMERAVVVPSTLNTPKGGFTSAYFMDDEHARALFGVTTPSTDFTYCSIIVTSPDGTTFEWAIDQDNLDSYIANETLTFFLADLNQDGLITTGDYIGIVSSESHLAYGSWTIALLYDYTGEKINQIDFDLSAP